MMVRVQILSFLLILLPFCSLQPSFSSPLASPSSSFSPYPLLPHSPPFPPSGQAKLITKMIIVPGQIGMRPHLHCTPPFGTCYWFTNSTKIPGGPHSIRDSLGSRQNTVFGSIAAISWVSSTCTDVILLFTMLSQISMVQVHIFLHSASFPNKIGESTSSLDVGLWTIWDSMYSQQKWLIKMEKKDRLRRNVW